jgi:hypothetical protein
MYKMLYYQSYEYIFVHKSFVYYLVTLQERKVRKKFMKHNFMYKMLYCQSCEYKLYVTY